MQQQPEPEVPANREELRAALWRFLKERLAARKKAGMPVGDTSAHVPFPSAARGGGVVSWGPLPYDATLDGEGRQQFILHFNVHEHELPSKVMELAPVLLEEMYELLRAGILRPCPSRPLHLLITEHGAFCLDQELQDMPPASTERVAAFLEEFAGSPDVDVLARHLGEAVAAYRAGLNLSATVMIGCCYELGLGQLADAVCALEARWGSFPTEISRKTRASVVKLRAGKLVGAADQDDLVQEVLTHLSPDLGEDKDWVTTCLPATSFFVRSLRNAAGHPTGKAIPRDQIASHIMLFTAYRRRVCSLVATLATIQPPTP
jgi:hypothetical protein